MKINNTNLDSLIKKEAVPEFVIQGERYAARMLYQSEHFIVGLKVVDWHFDDLIIINKRYLQSLRYGKQEKFREKVLLSINSINDREMPQWLDVASWAELLRSLESKRLLCCVQSKKKDDDFRVGFVSQVSEKKFGFHRIDLSYDLVGSEPEKFLFKNIGYISLDNEYCLGIEEFVNSRRGGKYRVGKTV